MVAQSDFVTAEFLRLCVQVTSAHARAEITGGIPCRRFRRGKNIRSENLHGNVQERCVFLYFSSVRFVIAGVHDQKDEVEIHLAMAVEFLHELREEHAVLPARNTNRDFIALRDEAVFLYRQHERRPKHFPISSDDGTFYFLIFFQLLGHLRPSLITSLSRFRTRPIFLLSPRPRRSAPPRTAQTRYCPEPEAYTRPLPSQPFPNPPPTREFP